MDCPNALDSRLAGEPDIAEENIGRIGFDCGDRFFHGAVLPADLQPRRCDEVGQALPGRNLIFDKGYADRGHPSKSKGRELDRATTYSCGLL